MIPITGVEVPIDGYLPVEIPQVVNISQIETQPEIQQFNDCSNNEIETLKSVKLKPLLSTSPDNIIYASITEADICKCEPQECQQSSCCLDCSGRADICPTVDSASNFSSTPSLTVNNNDN